MGWLHISYFLNRCAIKTLRKAEILQENCRNPAQTRGMLKERCSVETLDVGQWSFLVRGRQDQSCRSPPAQFPLGQPHSICVFVPIYIVHLCIFYLCICEVTYLCICGKTKGQAQRPAKQPYRTARRSSRPDRLQKLRFCKVFFREFIGQHSLNIKKVSWEPRQ